MTTCIVEEVKPEIAPDERSINSQKQQQLAALRELRRKLLSRAPMKAVTAFEVF